MKEFKDIVVVLIDGIGKRVYRAPSLCTLEEGDKVIVSFDGYETIGTVAAINSYVRDDSSEEVLIKRLIGRESFSPIIGRIVNFEYEEEEDGTADN